MELIRDGKWTTPNPKRSPRPFLQVKLNKQHLALPTPRQVPAQPADSAETLENAEIDEGISIQDNLQMNDHQATHTYQTPKILSS